MPVARFLARFTADGVIDTTFGGGDGIVSIPDISGVDRQSDGKLVVYSEAGGAARVYRYHADGSPDTGFGGDTAGVITLPLAPVTDLGLTGKPRETSRLPATARSPSA